jgi:Xaa-Pro aminopeptidase
MYRIVKDAQDLVFDQCRSGKLNRQIEATLCRFFEKHGHTTFLSNPRTQQGYCHSLGHGLGLNVHERPTFGLFKTNTNRISRGQVFTIEPGLYYPEQGFGIRLEDVAYMNSRGKVENLTKCARRLVIGM